LNPVREGYTAEQAASFGAAAAEHERSRPTYPDGVVDWIRDRRPEGERRQFFAAVRDLVAAHPDLAGSRELRDASI
jgi:hypothetical protein